MRIIIFHYHLNPGGVTRIVESQVKALRETNPQIQIKVITGGCQDTQVFKNNNVALLVDSALNYLSNTEGLFDKLESITTLLKEEVQPGDVLHFHNLNLGKNPLVTLAIYNMVKEGWKVINHAHDFSEDRPANHNFLKNIIEDTFNTDLNEVMYPDLPNYHFATLNSFDKNRLIRYGVVPERITLLPNPVVFEQHTIGGNLQDWKQDIENALHIDSSKMLITYPVRVIRRKNIGEFILLAVLFESIANWVVTQPPKNPIEIEPYEKWKKFCLNESINICWEAGNKVDFEKLLRTSDFCISTSIQEGFGMVFMEPWLLNTPVIGRNISMVTEDMINSGIRFSCLFDHFYVQNSKQMHELDMMEQMQIIKRAKTDKHFSESLIRLNPFINNMLKNVDASLIQKNKEVILNDYSLSNYGKQLYEAYRRIIK
jgi:glycosyltransferase involved in cell wall biosynthesis